MFPSLLCPVLLCPVLLCPVVFCQLKCIGKPIYSFKQLPVAFNIFFPCSSSQITVKCCQKKVKQSAFPGLCWTALLTYIVQSCCVLSCPVRSCLVLSCLVESPFLVLSPPSQFCLVSFNLFGPNLVKFKRSFSENYITKTIQQNQRRIN